MRSAPRARLGALLLAAAAGLATGPAAAGDLRQSIEQELNDLDAALFPPREVEKFRPIDSTWTCDALSEEVTRLVPGSRSYRPSFYSDPVNAAIFAAGTAFTPAFYLFGVPEYARYREKRHLVNAAERIAALRAEMARRDCYSN